MKKLNGCFFAPCVLLWAALHMGVFAGSACAQTGDVPIIKARHLYNIESGFLHPSDVSVGPQGNIYVVDGVNNRVKIFNKKGAYLSSFGSKGSGIRAA